MEKLQISMKFKLMFVVLCCLFISRVVLVVEARRAAFSQPNSSIPIPKETIEKRPDAHVLIDGAVEFAGIVVNSPGMMGASASIKIEKPSADSGQWTTASIIIENGGDQLETGWMVNSNSFPDGQPRLYAHWKSANLPGCYNMDCPGFVAINPDITLGYVFPQVSRPTGERYETKITVEKIQEDWYLEIYEDTIGFWNGSLFKDLSKSANTIRFGGQAFSPNEVGPQMGSGAFKNNNPVRTAYMQNVQVLAGRFIDPPNYTVAESRCYVVGFHDYGLLQGFKFLYGGKGGRPKECLG